MFFDHLTNGLLEQEAIQIGITGHRRNRMTDAECEALAVFLTSVFAEFEAKFHGAATLISGMADGSDCAAVRAMPNGWSLNIPLADHPGAWLEQLGAVSSVDAATFGRLGSMSSIMQLPEPYPNYEGVAEHLLAEADVLIGVWNGEPGLPSGTADVMGRAKEKGILVFHVSPWKPTRLELMS